MCSAGASVVSVNVLYALLTPQDHFEDVTFCFSKLLNKDHMILPVKSHVARLAGALS